MYLNDADVKFMSELVRVGNANREGDKQQLITAKGYLSLDVVRLLGLTEDGGWVGNVYVKFEPMFKLAPAEEWQS